MKLAGISLIPGTFLLLVGAGGGDSLETRLIMDSKGCWHGDEFTTSCKSTCVCT